jgi:hypothetical protein
VDIRFSFMEVSSEDGVADDPRRQTRCQTSAFDRWGSIHVDMGRYPVQFRVKSATSSASSASTRRHRTGAAKCSDASARLAQVRRSPIGAMPQCSRSHRGRWEEQCHEYAGQIFERIRAHDGTNARPDARPHDGAHHSVGVVCDEVEAGRPAYTPSPPW